MGNSHSNDTTSSDTATTSGTTTSSSLSTFASCDTTSADAWDDISSVFSSTTGIQLPIQERAKIFYDGSLVWAFDGSGDVYVKGSFITFLPSRDAVPQSAWVLNYVDSTNFTLSDSTNGSLLSYSHRGDAYWADASTGGNGTLFSFVYSTSTDSICGIQAMTNSTTPYGPVYKYSSDSNTMVANPTGANVNVCSLRVYLKAFGISPIAMSLIEDGVIRKQSLDASTALNIAMSAQSDVDATILSNAINAQAVVNARVAAQLATSTASDTLIASEKFQSDMNAAVVAATSAQSDIDSRTASVLASMNARTASMLAATNDAATASASTKSMMYIAIAALVILMLVAWILFKMKSTPMCVASADAVRANKHMGVESTASSLKPSVPAALGYVTSKEGTAAHMVVKS